MPALSIATYPTVWTPPVTPAVARPAVDVWRSTDTRRASSAFQNARGWSEKTQSYR
jgi:hypothetical protein